MSAKRAKEYLNRYHKMRRAITILERSIEDQAIRAQGVSAIRYDKDRVQTSPSNRLETDALRLAELKDRYADLLDAYRQVTLQIVQQVTDMPNPMHADILRLKYLETDRSGRRLSMTQISHRIGKGYDWTCHQHGEALREFYRRYIQQ